MKLQEKFDWFIAKLEKEGYKLDDFNLVDGCGTYKYIGDNKTLQTSIVKVWEPKPKEWKYIRKMKIKFIVGDKEYKNISMEKLISQIKFIKQYNEPSILI